MRRCYATTVPIRRRQQRQEVCLHLSKVLFEVNLLEMAPYTDFLLLLAAAVEVVVGSLVTTGRGGGGRGIMLCVCVRVGACVCVTMFAKCSYLFLPVL